MALAFGIAVHRLPADLSFTDALSIAGRMGKLQAVDFSIDPSKRYTVWSGILGGFFLSLSYFGADQSQVQRYLAGGSLRASRIGLLFNALVKVRCNSSSCSSAPWFFSSINSKSRRSFSISRPTSARSKLVTGEAEPAPDSI